MNNNQKATKRALLTSVMALVMCVVMLVGTTFAWFTDTASTGVNKIQAGNLDVELLMYNGEEYVNISKEKEPIFGSGTSAVAQNNNLDTLWEPGKTQVAYLAIENKGNLALKYKVALNVTNPVDGKDLYKVMQYAIVPDAKNDNGKVTGWTASDGKTVDVGRQPVSGEVSLAVGATHYFALLVHMDELAGNNYQNGKVDFDLTVYATQDTVENDSFNDQYDKDATYLTYPAGVTDAIFDSKTEADYSIPGGTTGKAQAVAAYVASNGNVQYTADVKTALDNGASTIYLKKDTKGRLMALTDFLAQPNRTSDVTKDITIYANGADFEYGELAINTTDAGKNANFTIKIYDAKNIRVWGNTPNAGVTQNIILENCTYEGTGIGTNAAGGIFFAYGETGTINLTMNNCKVSGSDQGVYFGCDGSLTVKDSSFTECATGIKVSYKGNGTRTDRIENCVFTKCGCTTEMAGTSSYLAEDSAAFKYKNAGGQITLTLKNNTITGTIGDKGDMQIATNVTVNE